jgi:DNA-binding CsgD family transcriptional regulator
MEDVTRSAVMVGRDVELAQLAAAFDLAAAGDAQVVVVRGVAGIGKTRLVRQAVSQMPVGTTVAFGHAMPPPGGSLPLGVGADLLRSLVRGVGVEKVRRVLGPRTSVLAPLVPLLGKGADRTVDRFALMAATQDLLCGLADDTSPLVLVVEDAHWCDSSSMELLAFWARSLVRGQSVIVVTTRLTVDDQRVVGQLGSVERLPNATVIDLAPLSSDEVGEQAMGLDRGLSVEKLARVRALCDGNPLYVEELVAHGGDGISQAVALDLSAGLRAMPAGAVKVLDMLALESRPVESATLAVVTDTSMEEIEEILDEAFSRGLVARRGATSWEFHHELLRRAAVESQTPSSQTTGHRAWAEWLDELADPRLADRVASATHWVEAGENRPAFAAFRAAALASEKVAKSEEAFALWRSALALIHEDPRVASEAEHREAFGRACTILINGPSWVDLVEAEKAAVPHAAGTLGWFLRCWSYNMDRRLGNDTPNLLSREQLGALLDHLLSEPPDALLAATLFEVFMTAEWHGYHDQMEASVAALAQVEAALPREVSAGMDVVVVARIATLHGRGDAAQRLEVAERALAGGQDRDWATLSWLHGTYAAQLIAHGRLNEGLTHAEASMELVPGQENESHWYIGAENATWALWLMGRWDASLAIAERCHDDGTAVFTRFHAALRRGEPLPRQMAEGGAGPEIRRLLRLCDMLASAQSSVAARDEQAVVSLRGALDELPMLQPRVGDGLILLAEMASGLPGPDAALEAAIRDTAEGALWRGALDDAWLAHLYALLSRHQGQDETETWLRTTDTWDQIGAPVEAARCRLYLAEKLLGTGDRDGAAYELSRALATFDSVGAAPSSAAVRRIAGQARLLLPGERVGPSSERGGLTGREYEVLQLLVVGRTNDQIAETLYISPKTASVHVSHILQKLGAANRTEVASIAHRRGLVATS